MAKIRHLVQRVTTSLAADLLGEIRVALADDDPDRAAVEAAYVHATVRSNNPPRGNALLAKHSPGWPNRS